MSVSTWQRDKSTADFIQALETLNVKCGQLVMNKPKKYQKSYGDHLIRVCLEALEEAQAANGIFPSPNTPQRLRDDRLSELTHAASLCEHASTACHIFLKLCEIPENKEDIAKQDAQFGGICETCIKLLNGVIKSDKKRY